MHVCANCHQRGVSIASSRCRGCLDRHFDTVIWPSLRATLPAVATLCQGIDATPVLAAERAFTTALNRIRSTLETFPIESSLGPSEVVYRATGLWREYLDHADRYRQHVTQSSPAWEFRLLLQAAFQKRTRWGFDIERGQWFPGYYPLTVPERIRTYMALISAVFQDAVLQCGWVVLETTQHMQLPLLAGVQEAARAMRETQIQGAAWTLIALLPLHIPDVQQWARAVSAGWLKAQTRLYPSHYKALQEHHISLARLSEYLVAWVAKAHDAGARTPRGFLDEVQRQVDGLRRTFQPRGRPRSISQHAVQLFTPAHDTRQALDVFAQQRTREHAHRTWTAAQDRANLSAQERRICDMRHDERMSYQEIAARENISVGAVGSILNRVKKKMRGERH